MLRNMAVSLLRHETIRTTLPKAKELRRVVEPMITLGKSDSEPNRRLAFARLRDTAVVGKLFTDLGPRFRVRPGGYTRILRMEPRPGDSAPMALMQLVDRPAPAAVEQAANAEATAKAKRPAKPPKDKEPAAKASKAAKAGKAAKPEADDKTTEKAAAAPRKAGSGKTAGKTAKKKAAKKA